jgi:hypothetical protein
MVTPLVFGELIDAGAFECGQAEGGKGRGAETRKVLLKYMPEDLVDLPHPFVIEVRLDLPHPALLFLFTPTNTPKN